MYLKIPPAFQLLFFIILMWLTKKMTSQVHFSFAYQKEIAWVLFFIALILGLLAVLSFKKAKTTANPMLPNKASKLVTRGLYNYSRNPMYLALLIILLSFFIRLGSLYNFLVLIAFILFITEYQIKPEEKSLTEIFGKEYINYKTHVRRWL